MQQQNSLTGGGILARARAVSQTNGYQIVRQVATTQQAGSPCHNLGHTREYDEARGLRLNKSYSTNVFPNIFPNKCFYPNIFRIIQWTPTKMVHDTAQAQQCHTPF